MADGAVGFSTGLQYVPGMYAKPNEIIELARVAAQRGRHLRHAHAQRRHRARGRGGRVDSRRQALDMRAADFASQGGQSQPMGRERRGAEADRRRRAPGTEGAGRPVRLHRRLVVSVDQVSVVGARGRRRTHARAAATIRRRGRRSSRRCRRCSPSAASPICRGRRWPAIARTVAERPVDEAGGGEDGRRADRPMRRSRPRGCS